MSILYTKARSRGSKIPESWWGSSNNSRYNNLGDELTPKLSEINIVNDFSWTLTPTNSIARKEAPFIILREFLQLDTQLNQCLQPYGRSPVGPQGLPTPSNPGGIFGAADTLNSLFQSGASPVDLNNVNELYKGLFDHKISTDFIYKLPFFTTEYFSIQNNWSGVDALDQIVKLQSMGLGLGRGIFNFLTRRRNEQSTSSDDSDATKGDYLLKLPQTLRQFELFNLRSSSPTVGLMDPPHTWNSTNNRQYTFSFPLYNIDYTSAIKTTDIIIKNWEFCYLITYQNLINKGNFYTAIPPVFYEVLIPGIHYCKASYMSDINIENIGNIRRMKLDINGYSKVDVNVPDGYYITITLTDLLMPSKNLLNAATNTQLRAQIQQNQI
jgi:hypothetical protein